MLTNELYDTQTELSSSLDFAEKALGIQKHQNSSKSYRFFALALGMMCCRSLVNCTSSSQLETESNFDVQKMLVQTSNSEIEDKLISMEIESRDDSFEDNQKELKTA